MHAAVNSLAWPSNYKLDKYDDEEKAAQGIPLDLEVDGVTVAGNIFQDYIPRKSGIDAETHIEEGDVFNFDREIDPVIKVIVDKTCEQALMEVEQESYLSNLSQYAQHSFQNLSGSNVNVFNGSKFVNKFKFLFAINLNQNFKFHINVLSNRARANFQDEEKKTLEDYQAQDDAEKARQQEMERTIKQARKMYKTDLRTQKRIASHEFAKNMLANLVADVLDREEQRGSFISKHDVAISEEFMPWLLQQTIQSVAQEKEISTAVHDIQKAVIQEACNEHAQFVPQWIEADAARLLGIL